MQHDPRLLVLSGQDNVAVLTATVHAGECIQVAGRAIEIASTLGLGHKLALRAIRAGDDIVKYGFPIGFAAEDIALGGHVHVHNLSSRYTTVEITE
ncbi:UxaA family hydrolase [Cognatishimia sp. SS12]|uniref:UxaA family hydrolase n=1 Tax=Cognatishimia sp. SS12 TaxID=2979465 RepID=UPI00232F7250|nr:UxaA family hydrolase [Cognatishimia sp. SS12]MDC0737788.1 UxaA family hydrolase [Cognatishimia sp. SS12]